MPVAAIPAHQTVEVVQTLRKALPQFVPEDNVLKTSFNNIGAVFHPTITILNAGRIESTHGGFDYYIEGVTPSVALILEEVDKERAELYDVLAAGKKLEDWLASLDTEQQEAAAPLLLDLAENLGRLQSLNDLNQELLSQSLSYVQFSLNLLMGDDTSPTYARPGGNTAGKSIFDRKV